MWGTTMTKDEIAAARKFAESSLGTYSFYPERALAENLVRLCDEVERLQECKDCLAHALAFGHFTPGGSTEGWAKRCLGEVND